MIQSMTGFGKSLVSLPDKKITVEIKSLNSKNLDLNVRIPSKFREKELVLRNLIASSLIRGKVDFSVFVESTEGETSAKVNVSVVQKYMNELQKIPLDGEKNEMELLKIAMNLPDTLKTEREEINIDEFRALQNGVEEALTAINEFRSDEGKALEREFELRIANLHNLLSQVMEMDPERINGVRERLRKGIETLKESVDENRFEQELVYYIEKYDITEEKTRLENHLVYFSENLDSEDSNGKKLGFIAQEIGREVNTIGSKSNFAPMQQLVVQMKDELEKIKEQLLNVL
ncbi:MAG TPA: YicC/YloC family endoribonuclease [Flavobacteriaceae bacterium]|nr:YicC/YloC family endoribonuclease [Flavobacteriaceae bacterium]